MSKVAREWCQHIALDFGGLFGRWGCDWVLKRQSGHRSFSMDGWDYCPYCGIQRPLYPSWCKTCGHELRVK